MFKRLRISSYGSAPCQFLNDVITGSLESICRYERTYVCVYVCVCMYLCIYIYIWRYGLPWHKLLNAVIAELSISKLKTQRRRIDSL